jgi:transcriptional regulator with XRE-family HTH domain
MSDPYRGVKAALGRNIRVLRLRQNLSQEELAESAGVDRKWIGELERATGNPTLQTLTRIAMALQVTPGQLLDGQFQG